MIQCFEKVSPEELAGPAGNLDAKCAAEKNAVRSILEGNELTMTNVVRDRVQVLYAMNSAGIESKTVFTGDE